MGNCLSQIDYTLFIIHDDVPDFLKDNSSWMPELIEKIWYKPVCWKEFDVEENRLMGRIKTEFNLDQLFSYQEESDTKTFVTSHSRNVSVKMLVDSNKIEIENVEDPA